MLTKSKIKKLTLLLKIKTLSNKDLLIKTEEAANKYNRYLTTNLNETDYKENLVDIYKMYLLECNKRKLKF